MSYMKITFYEKKNGVKHTITHVDYIRKLTRYPIWEVFFVMKWVEPMYIEMKDNAIESIKIISEE